MPAFSGLVCWSWHMPVIYVGNLTACTLLAVTVVTELFPFISQARARLISCT